MAGGLVSSHTLAGREAVSVMQMRNSGLVLQHREAASKKLFCEFFLKICLIEVTEKFGMAVGTKSSR
jgi:hypothetical protein